MNYEELANKILEFGDRRSSVYREGMIAVIKRRIEDVPVPVPYVPGSLEFDAYFAGKDRGHHEWRNALIESDNNRDKAIKRLQILATGRAA